MTSSKALGDVEKIVQPTHHTNKALGRKYFALRTELMIQRADIWEGLEGGSLFILILGKDQVFLSTNSRNSLPALKKGTLLAGTST